MNFNEIQREKIAAFLRNICAERYSREDNIPCQIEEALFLGSIGVARNKDVLKRFNITHILTVALSLDPAYPNDFIYKKIEVLDNPQTKLDDHFEECIDFIDEARRLGGAVLVHCFAGISRSVSIIIAYLMKKHRMSLSKALEHVRSKRPQASPNIGFMLQLKKYGTSLGVNEETELE